MYAPPADPVDERRMVAAHHRAATRLGVTVTGPASWGWNGRTLGRRGHHRRHGDCWLRLDSAPAGRRPDVLWEGASAAWAGLPGVPQPRLYAVDESRADQMLYHAELAAYLSSQVCFTVPVLSAPLDLPDRWWASLRTSLTAISAARTDRPTVRRQWLDRAFPRFLGLPPPRCPEFTTAHGDLHWSNLTRQGPVLLDWEAYGTAPRGYDAALLLAYSLLVPQTAARVRAELGHLLDTPAGRVARLTAAAELLENASRGDHPELVPKLQEFAADAGAPAV
ncbi:phosphotransferase [Streptomyces sp. NPDC051133]|uniref:phosphotransferase n=1 Tax=Streptomyces sp. NPDC051133 TaxID=3155521 RepID=UPI00341DBE09